MKIGKKEIKISKKRVIFLILLLFLTALAGVLGVFVFWKSDHTLYFEKVQMKSPGRDIKFPGAVWSNIEQDMVNIANKNNPQPPKVEKPAPIPKNRLVIDRKEIERISKRLPQVIPFPFTVQLIEKTEGILGRKNYHISYPENGGVLDLSNYVEDKPGSFYLKVFWNFESLPIKNAKVYFISRSKIRQIDGKAFGSGCDHFFDLTNFWFKSMEEGGIFLNNLNMRHISVLAGTYYFNIYKNGAIHSAQLEIFDSTRRDLLCH